MPKIVIREFDKTTAAGAAYANFSVVVPGFYSAVDNKDNKTGAFAFDENGVYECNNQKEFKTKIGLVSPLDHKVADASAPERAEGWDDRRALTEAQFDELVTSGQLYKADTYTEGSIGECRDENYEYTEASADLKSTYVFKEHEDDADADTYTKFMKLEDPGTDELYEDHYGNQIAYELLGLGYTVLYKRIASSEYLAQSEWWAPLRDKTLYDFRYIISGLINGNAAVYKNMVDLAEFKPENVSFDIVSPTSHGRGDCVALLDIDESEYKGRTQETAITNILAFAKSNVPTSKYAAVFAPAVKYAKGGLSEFATFDNQWFPASFHYLACAARSSERFSEWYANAGYTRGVSDYTIEAVSGKFGEAAVNMFQKRSSDPDNNVVLAINPIINLRGTYYLWGNRTTFALGAKDTDDGDLKASHFLNIRQLCSSIKKKVYVACRQITFDPNSNALWTKFCNSIKPLLEKMKADQGIADYKILKVKNNRKAFLSVIIRIVPIEAVEDFDISIYLEDSLEGTIAATAEE
jgi:hypothetical protein